MNRRELRRLALRASRDASLRPVLHDALLETYPLDYEKTIAVAHGAAKEHRRAMVVVFNPLAMGRDRPVRPEFRLSEYVRLFSVYDAQHFEVDHHAALWWRHNEFRRGEVVVYLAEPPPRPLRRRR